jgi:heme exporter protein D
MSVLVWGAVATAVVVGLARLLVDPIKQAREALARRRQARLRAEALLLAWLSPDQRAQYLARGRFEVTTAAGHRYRVCPGGVVRLDPRGWAYCIEATSPVPVADEMLAFKLLLETDERLFLATAHRYPYH